MVLSQDFREFIKSLNDNHIRYLVVGGYAVAFHGHPRYTKDLDVWIELSPENAANMVKALKQFGFESLNLKESDFLVPDQIIQLGYPPNRIDVHNTLIGVEFNSCWDSRIQVEDEGVMISCINLENLIMNKRASGRHQDLADLENLE
jgi:predicted nucleotidyltransferase